MKKTYTKHLKDVCADHKRQEYKRWAMVNGISEARVAQIEREVAKEMLNKELDAKWTYHSKSDLYLDYYSYKW